MASSSESYEYPSVNCDLCGERELEFPFFHCDDCKDFDLCEDCYATLQKGEPKKAIGGKHFHQTHKMNKIKDLMNHPYRKKREIVTEPKFSGQFRAKMAIFSSGRNGYVPYMSPSLLDARQGLSCQIKTKVANMLINMKDSISNNITWMADKISSENVETLRWMLKRENQLRTDPRVIQEYQKHDDKEVVTDNLQRQVAKEAGFRDLDRGVEFLRSGIGLFPKHKEELAKLANYLLLNKMVPEQITLNQPVPDFDLYDIDQQKLVSNRVIGDTAVLVCSSQT